MFCYQCEQTAKTLACTVKGVCGKEDEVASLQDVLIYCLKGLALTVDQAAPRGLVPADTYPFLAEGMFVTLTNVNFDSQAIKEWADEAVGRREAVKAALLKEQPGATFPDGPASFLPADTVEGLADQGRAHGVNAEASPDPNIRSLQHAILYGLKGVAAYVVHASELGYHDPECDSYVAEALARLSRFDQGDLKDWLAEVFRCGEMNYKTMALLDKANTESFGTPVPTEVPLGVRKGKAILVSGHDLADLDALLQQTKGKGITVYTHGEMLPAHGYPKLKAYSHLYGNFGGAWYLQRQQFPEFPGAIVMTSNCIQIPLENYADRIFTRSIVGAQGIKHLKDHDFTPAIDAALALPGFLEDSSGKTVRVGYMRGTVLAQAEKVLDLVKAGRIRHIFLVGGCDGAKPGRDYYTRFVEQAPPDTLILTLACGKYRFYDQDLGAIDGLPRLLDMGQCNDSYSAIQVALALSEALKVGVNDLPLSLIVSWYEQKAVAIILALLYLGIKNVRLGPTLPAFMTEDIRQYIFDTFGWKPVTTPEEDLAAILGT